MTAAKPGPFKGIRILSLAEQYPGPFATMLMADLGADVVMVERPSGGDPTRTYPSFFAALARNKRSVCIDLKSTGGRRQLTDLATTADVLVEGYTPGTMDRLGVGYGAFEVVNPRLIYASISGFGQTGPYSDRPGHDISCQAISGHLSAGGDANASPLQHADLCGAMFAAFSIAAALFARERTGRGTSIDVSIADCLVSWMTSQLGPIGNGTEPLDAASHPAYGRFTCRDGAELTIGIVHEDHFWRSLCRLLGMHDDRDLSAAGRTSDEARLRGLIRTRVAGEDFDHWAGLFDGARLPWSPVHSLADVIGDAHFGLRGMFASVPSPTGAAEFHVNQPLRFGAYEGSILRSWPTLGQHTAEVLGPITG